MTQLKNSRKINENPLWPYFQWTSSQLIDSLSQVRFEQGWLAAKQDELEPSQQGIDIGQLFTTNQQLPVKFQPLIQWWNNTPKTLDPIICSGIAFLWIYLIEDNLDLAVSAVEASLQKDEFYLFSKERFLKKIYLLQSDINNSIESCHNSECDITSWLLFFIKNLTENFIETKSLLQKINWAKLNSRQKYAVCILIKNQEPFLTNKKYLDLTFTSRESAKRDLKELVLLGLLRNSSSKGRSVEYLLKT